jgi:hypothetical protein
MPNTPGTADEHDVWSHVEITKVGEVEPVWLTGTHRESVVGGYAFRCTVCGKLCSVVWKSYSDAHLKAEHHLAFVHSAGPEGELPRQVLQMTKNYDMVT